MVGGPLEAEAVAIEGAELAGERRRAETVAVGADFVERRDLDVRREAGERVRPLHAPDEPQEGDPRHHPERAVEPVRDRLDAVGRGRSGPRPVVRLGHHRAEEPAAQPPALGAWQDEQHRQEPQAIAGDRRDEGVDGARAVRSEPFGHDEPLGVRRLQVAVQPQDRAQVVGAEEVVVQGVAPDRGAGREVLGRRRAEDVVARGGAVARLDPRRGRHAASEPSSPRRALVPPVATRSSSARMKSSRSPSRTACVLPVSWAVRRSLTIW